MATWRKPRNPRPNYRRTSFRNKMARVWTPQEIAFLRKFYRNHQTTWCANQLGRTVYSIRYKASTLSIRKTNPSNWVNPTTTKVTFGSKYQTRRRTPRTPRRNVRWASTRRNNRRTKW